jgi:hypothetical protein
MSLAIIDLIDECIFLASELAVVDQSMIYLNYVGSTDEHSSSESRKNALCWNVSTLSA